MEIAFWQIALAAFGVGIGIADLETTEGFRERLQWVPVIRELVRCAFCISLWTSFIILFLDWIVGQRVIPFGNYLFLLLLVQALASAGLTLFGRALLDYLSPRG